MKDSEIDKIKLSAYLDGELDEDEAAIIKAAVAESRLMWITVRLSPRPWRWIRGLSFRKRILQLSFSDEYYEPETQVKIDATLENRRE